MRRSGEKCRRLEKGIAKQASGWTPNWAYKNMGHAALLYGSPDLSIA